MSRRSDSESPPSRLGSWTMMVVGALTLAAGEILRESGREPVWIGWALLIAGVALVLAANVGAALRGLRGVGKDRRSGD